MSENINNTSKRKAELKEIIRTLNTAKDHDKAKKEMKKRFASLLKDISPEEIAEAEQSLISEGMAVSEVQKLCEIHVDAFEDSLKKNEKIDKKSARLSKIPGHPVATYRAENAALKKEIKYFLKELRSLNTASDVEHVKEALASVALVEVHYARKENQLFPFLENVGFSGPSKVMWGKHDEIRELFRSFRSSLELQHFTECKKKGKELARSLNRMIFMEEKILFPTALRKLPEATWITIRRGEAAIGYSWIKPGNLWDANIVESFGNNSEKTSAASNNATSDGDVHLATGVLTVEQLDLMLKNLPIDVSFIDENDIVRYYNDVEGRIFPRSPGVIGRTVQNCHPPSSVSVVQTIIDDFKSRKKTEAEFWIQMKGKFVLIKYFPLFSGNTFKGIIEVSQEVSAIRALEGEKRLL
ncbi:MAG TPA: DUF438 domain-containing protein [Treponemataceae bacterium]|nr:DUF438 domain-containing protein [Treponemataceae bacterium]